jgi:sigma54-dependent transcription regulator
MSLTSPLIDQAIVDEETSGLSVTWHKPEIARHDDELGQFLTPKQLEKLDLFDRAQLAFVVDVCRRSRSLLLRLLLRVSISLFWTGPSAIYSSQNSANFLG